MLFSEAVLAANRNHFKKKVVVTLSTINMTAAGGGGAALQQFYQENSNKSTAKPSATVVATGALAGAGTGVLLGFAMSHSQGTASSSHFLRALGHMYLGGTPHRMDLRITW
jgi:ABC-type nitrate/sulfonate/bicarbonate transport system permease component